MSLASKLYYSLVDNRFDEPAKRLVKQHGDVFDVTFVKRVIESYLPTEQGPRHGLARRQQFNARLFQAELRAGFKLLELRE
eukprot:CAMPEP_0205911130 /NCGR_PEP_ID=MMETSP1325-20131115/4939_1 /ASSEMBLY_ACC=CAM_ASM_000708 /TAXON_ID=236786 /ORGANISM="Florenciella sp., Strain RCC1007" /LENGTH=80 /DNA_ID=CAMNT_0053277605 /DNA_START=107 /DNA_END=346 /DNA_ORIENTATION=-